MLMQEPTLDYAEGEIIFKILITVLLLPLLHILVPKFCRNFSAAGSTGYYYL